MYQCIDPPLHWWATRGEGTFRIVRRENTFGKEILLGRNLLCNIIINISSFCKDLLKGMKLLEMPPQMKLELYGC